MELQFYSKGNKLSNQKGAWAKIFLKDFDWVNEYDDEENKFEITDETVEDVPIFISQAVGEYGKKLFTSTLKYYFTRLFEKNAPEAILGCRLEFFKETVWFSNQEEMDPSIKVVPSGLKTRTILYYAFIGEDRCALLIAYEECEDEDD